MTSAYTGPYTTASFLGTTAARRIRLIGFEDDYGPSGYTLKLEHKAALDQLLKFVSQTSSFSYWVIGYASKIGDHPSNKRLSANRASATQRYLAASNPLFADGDRLSFFEWRGDEAYRGDDTDNSPEYRAVEVHIFLGDVKPPVPVEVQKVQRIRSPLPGKPRSIRWKVAAVFGIQVTVAGFGPAGVQVTANLYGFRKLDGGEETHWYISPGVGIGISIPALGAFKNAGNWWTAITAPSWSGWSFTDAVTAKNAFNFDDLDHADVSLVQVGAGLKPPSQFTPFGDKFVPSGYQFARMMLTGPVWYYDDVDQPFFKQQDLLVNVDISGPQAALGAGIGLGVSKLWIIK